MDASEVLTEKEIKESLDTCSPVVSWVTVRLMMIFGLLLSLQSKSIDFSNAFVQAELESPVFLEIPQGYESKETGDMVLELNRSLYGQIEAPKLWCEKLKNGMEAQNFKTSELDPCLFISKRMVCTSCVDDCLHWFKDDKTFNKLIKTFKDDGDKFNWEMTVEQDVTAFLGIQILQKKDGCYKLIQTGLINKVLNATGMEDCNSNLHPAVEMGNL